MYFLKIILHSFWQWTFTNEDITLLSFSQEFQKRLIYLIERYLLLKQ